MSREYATEQVFQDIGSCSKVVLALATTQSANTSKTIRLPANVDDTLVGIQAEQTIYNKTVESTALNSCTINTSTINDPIIEGKDQEFTLRDYATSLKRAKFECSGISDNTTRTFTFPNASTTLVGTDVSQTLTNKTVDDSSNTITPSTASSTGLSTSGARVINLTTYPFSLRKVGNVVTMHWKGTDVANATATNVFTITGLIPSGWRPAAGDIQLPISIQQNTTRAWGSLLIQSSGNVQIGATPAHGNFTINQTAMWYQGSVSWVAGV